LKKELASTYDDALTKVSEELKNEGFGVLTEINVSKTLNDKLGVDFRRYKILGACNPALAHRALSASLEVGVLLPCNVVVYEADGGRAVVLAVDPTRTLAARDPRLADIAAIVKSKLARVLERLS